MIFISASSADAFLCTTMSSSYPVLPSRPLVPHIPATCPSCNALLEFPIPVPHPKQGTILQVKCFACPTILSHAFYPGQIPPRYNGHGQSAQSSGAASSTATQQQQQSSSSSQQRKGRKIGTQDRPLETGYYDILGIPVTATTDDIKKAYRASFLAPLCYSVT